MIGFVSFGGCVSKELKNDPIKLIEGGTADFFCGRRKENKKEINNKENIDKKNARK